MSDAKAVDAASDLLNTLLGIGGESPLAALRAQRADIASYIQASYDALLEPQEVAGVSRAERGLIALRIAILEESAMLTGHYRDYVAQQHVENAVVTATEAGALGAPLSRRLQAILAHVDLLTNVPDDATSAHLAALKEQGLSDADIVTISQLIAFVSFQVRTIVGLQLLVEGL